VPSVSQCNPLVGQGVKLVTSQFSQVKRKSERKMASAVSEQRQCSKITRRQRPDLKSWPISAPNIDKHYKLILCHMWVAKCFETTSTTYISDILHTVIYILYNVRVTRSVLITCCTCYPLKTPFGLLITLLQSQSHVTTITHNYFLRCYTSTRLYSLHVRDYNHLFHSYTFTQFTNTTLQSLLQYST
jgi:hypothetical protein